MALPSPAGDAATRLLEGPLLMWPTRLRARGCEETRRPLPASMIAAKRCRTCRNSLCLPASHRDLTMALKSREGALLIGRLARLDFA